MSCLLQALLGNPAESLDTLRQLITLAEQPTGPEAIAKEGGLHTVVMVMSSDLANYVVVTMCAELLRVLLPGGIAMSRRKLLKRLPQLEAGALSGVGGNGILQGDGPAESEGAAVNLNKKHLKKLRKRSTAIAWYGTASLLSSITPFQASCVLRAAILPCAFFGGGVLPAVCLWHCTPSSCLRLALLTCILNLLSCCRACHALVRTMQRFQCVEPVQDKGSSALWGVLSPRNEPQVIKRKNFRQSTALVACWSCRTVEIRLRIEDFFPAPDWSVLPQSMAHREIDNYIQRVAATEVLEAGGIFVLINNLKLHAGHANVAYSAVGALLALAQVPLLPSRQLFANRRPEAGPRLLIVVPSSVSVGPTGAAGNREAAGPSRHPLGHDLPPCNRLRRKVCIACLVA